MIAAKRTCHCEESVTKQSRWGWHGAKSKKIASSKTPRNDMLLSF